MSKEKTSKLKHPPESVLLNEMQLLLSEKRTYLSLLRTGLAVFTVPLTVIAFLGATGEYHGIFKNFVVALVTLGGLGIVSAIGLVIFFIAERKIKRLNALAKRIKKENKRVDDIII